MKNLEHAMESSHFFNSESRGIASLASWDGDGTGVINAGDAVFSQLAVWQDSNGDGRVAQSEYHHLSDLGITSLNYNLGTYRGTGKVTRRKTCMKRIQLRHIAAY